MIHDTETCDANNGQPCEMCIWAALTRQVPEESLERSIESELDLFRQRHGDEVLAQRLDRFMTERAIY